MVVTLSPQTEVLIRQKVERGEYQDADELVERAVRLLDERDRRERLIAALAEWEDGEAIPYTPELLEEIDRSAMRRAKAGEIPDPNVVP